MIAILGRGAPPDEGLARRMLAVAPHRGTQLTVRTLGNCILAVANRPDSADASVSSHGAMIAALTGRLDNGAALHAELVAMGHPPASPADADVVVSAFRTFGTEAPNRMRGAFAALVTDGTKVWGFRDHIGFRALFYRDDPQSFVAAGEPRQVVVGTQIAEEPDFDALELMFYGRMPAGAPAALKGVARVPQATVVTAGPVPGVTVRPYWHPESLLESSRLRASDVRERFLELMEQAVARSLTGNDLILLSGGLDSPAIAAFAAPEHQRRTGRPLGALSAVFPDLPSVDERVYIELVAQRFGIDSHTFRPKARALDDVDRWCRLFGSPVPVLSIPEVSDAYAMARGFGYTNVLTGEFAEFTFGSPMHLVAHLVTHGRARALVELTLAERRRGMDLRRMVPHMLYTFIPGRLANWYLHVRGRDAPHRIPAWLDIKKVELFRSDLLPSSRQRWLQLQLMGTQGSTVSMEAEATCAAYNGVTVRRPFADIDLWEFFLGLRAEVKCPDLEYKTLAKRMLRGTVPDEIIDRRRKTVFDDHVMTQVDYPTLRRLLVEPRLRMPNIDYAELARRIKAETFNRYDWFWAKDLAWIHAFLAAW